ncbi:MAG: hypothetical protein OXT67_13210 [Zetaproteobacteria bacterium]|nr:hypothetical protein [Zetaproteobacteria bacterium]
MAMPDLRAASPQVEAGKKFFLTRLERLLDTPWTLATLPVHILFDENDPFLAVRTIQLSLAGETQLSAYTRERGYELLGRLQRQLAVSRQHMQRHAYPGPQLQLGTDYNTYVNDWRMVMHLVQQVLRQADLSVFLRRKVTLIGLLTCLYTRDPVAFNAYKKDFPGEQSNPEELYFMLALTAELMWIMGDKRQALQVIEKVKDDPKTSLGGWLGYRRGWLQLQVGNVSQAYHTFYRTLQDLPENAPAELKSSLLHNVVALADRNEEIAAYVLEHPLEKHPVYTEQSLLRASLFFLRRQLLQPAQGGLEQVLRAFPMTQSSPLVALMLLDIYVSQGKIAAAEKIWQRLVEYEDTLDQLDAQPQRIFVSKPLYQKHLEKLGFHYIRDLARQYYSFQSEKLVAYQLLEQMIFTYLSKYPRSYDREKLWYYAAKFKSYQQKNSSASRMYAKVVTRMHRIRKMRNLTESEKSLLFSSLQQMLFTILPQVKRSVVQPESPVQEVEIQDLYIRQCRIYEKVRRRYDANLADCYHLLTSIYQSRQDLEKAEHYLWKVVANYPEKSYTEQAIQKILYLYRGDKLEQVQVADKILKLASLQNPDSYESLKQKIDKYRLVLAYTNPFHLEKAHGLFNLAMRDLSAPSAVHHLMEAFTIFDTLNLVAETQKVTNILMHNFPASQKVLRLLLDYAEKEHRRFAYEREVAIYAIFRKYAPNYRFINEVSQKQCTAAILADMDKMDQLCDLSYVEAPGVSAPNWNRVSRKYARAGNLAGLKRLSAQGWPENVPLSAGDKILHLARIYRILGPQKPSSLPFARQAVEEYVAVLTQNPHTTRFLPVHLKAIAEMKYRSLNQPLRAFTNTAIGGDSLEEYFASFEDLNAKLRDLVGLYQGVLDVGDPYWGSLVLYDLYLAFQHAAAEIEKDPRLEMKDFGTLKDKLRKASQDIRKRADSTLKECVKTMEKNSIQHEHSRKIKNAFYKQKSPEKQFLEVIDEPRYMSVIAPEYLEEAYAL